jgi:hypothetical protein
MVRHRGCLGDVGLWGVVAYHWGNGMEPNEAASTSARAQELRASLGTRREVEALLAEASATREAAAADADALIEEAQQVSEQLIRESRTEADRTTTDARLRAEGVVARARTEAEDITRQARAAADAVRARAEAQVEEHRRRVRAELTEQVTREVAEQSRRELARVQERQQAMIGDLEASVRILGVSMEAATAHISEMLGALESLRTHAAESMGDALLQTTAPTTTAPHTETAAERGDSAAGDPEDAAVADDGEGSREAEESDEPGEPGESDRVRGRAARSAHLVDVLAELDDDPPLTATEAFLRSSHLDHGDPPLPPTDDAEVGARYARDAMRATARARSRQSEAAPRPREQPDEDDGAGGEDADPSGKPLGWLFRS